ncbi:MAG: hypothetical protein AAF961_06075, partial [Planctomycetota bacterium]
MINVAEALVPLDAVGWWLIDVACKSSLLLLAALATHRWLLRRRPIAADLVWTSAMFLLLAIPIGSALLPRFPLPSLAVARRVEPATPSDAEISLNLSNRIALPSRAAQFPLPPSDAGLLSTGTERPPAPIEAKGWLTMIAHAALRVGVVVYAGASIALTLRMILGLWSVSRCCQIAAQVSESRWTKSL